MDEFTPLNLFGSEENEKKDETTSAAEVANDEIEEVVTEAENGENATENEKEVKQTELNSSESASEEVQETNDEAPVEETNDETPVEENEAQPDKLDKVLESQQKMIERLEALDALFNARIMHTDHEEKIVDQMHKELQKYKEDMYAQLVRPILLDVIEVRDSIMRMAATYLAKPEGEQNIPNKTFSDYAYDLQDILEKNSVDIYRSKSGDDFTPIKQRVIKKVATSDESLHGKVAESLSCGYSYNGRTISAEKITVYYYEKPVEENENSEVIENG